LKNTAGENAITSRVADSRTNSFAALFSHVWPSSAEQRASQPISIGRTRNRSLRHPLTIRRQFDILQLGDQMIELHSIAHQPSAGYRIGKDPSADAGMILQQLHLDSRRKLEM
jgi:hypothetical protein